MTEVQVVKSLEDIMAERGIPSLKAIALVHDLPPVRLYSVAKQPKEGEVYDAKVYNWDAVARFIQRRFDAEKGFTSFEQVIDAAMAMDEELKGTDGRRTRGTKVEKVEVDGKLVAQRKHPSFEIEAGMSVVLKGDDNVYKIVYQTVTHTVMIPVEADGTVISPDVKVISNGMLNYKGVGPADLDEAIKANFAAQAAKAEATATEPTVAE